MSTLAPAVTETLVAPWLEWPRRYTRGRRLLEAGTYALRPRRLISGKPKPAELYVHQPVSAHKESA